MPGIHWPIPVGLPSSGSVTRRNRPFFYLGCLHRFCHGTQSVHQLLERLYLSTSVDDAALKVKTGFSAQRLLVALSSLVTTAIDAPTCSRHNVDSALEDGIQGSVPFPADTHPHYPCWSRGSRIADRLQGPEMSPKFRIGLLREVRWLPFINWPRQQYIHLIHANYLTWSIQMLETLMLAAPGMKTGIQAADAMSRPILTLFPLNPIRNGPVSMCPLRRYGLILRASPKNTHWIVSFALTLR